MVYYSRYRPCRLSLQKERSLIRHALAVGQARIVFIVTYSPFTLKTFHLLYSHTLFARLYKGNNLKKERECPERENFLSSLSLLDIISLEVLLQC